jgi:MFS family permease
MLTASRPLTIRYVAILLCALPLGVGQSIFFLASSHTARSWLPDRAGLGMGVVNAGAGVGGVVFPLVFGRMVERHGFREAMVVLAVIAASLSAWVAVFGVPRPGRSANPGAKAFIGGAALNRLREPELALLVAGACALYAGVLSVSPPSASNALP